MAKDQGGQEKTEQPSQKRLDDSRKDGKVARSQELNSLAVFGTGLLILFLFKSSMAENLGNISKYIFSNITTLEINLNLVQYYFYKGFLFIIMILTPFFLSLFLVSLASGFGQAGFRITPKALKPKGDVLNPIKGMKNKFFSASSVVELIKSLLKLGIVALIAYIELSDSIIHSSGFIQFNPSEIINFMVKASYGFLWKILLVYAVFAISDFIYQKYDYKKNLKMTKQEVKDEHKDTEGDPLIKNKVLSKMLQMAQRRMMQDVPQADVVITNPTHVAVALKYEFGKDESPTVIAKGLDNVAQKIKSVAREHNIHMYEDVQLARTLYKTCEIGDSIPENLFKAVAQILAYVYKLKKNKKKSIV